MYLLDVCSKIAIGSSDIAENAVATGTGVTADMFRLANLFWRNMYASGLVPVF